MSLGRPPAQFTATLERLRSAVRAGRYRATGLLPGERELAGELAVSRTTVRRALGALVEEGVLVHRHGVGTFVATAATPPEETTSQLLKLGGFTEAMTRLGRVPSSRGVSHTFVQPTAAQAMLLAGTPRDRLMRVRRLRCADDEPVMVEENLIPADLCPDESAIGGSLYDELAAWGSTPVRALQRVQATTATAADAALLDVPVASPLILLVRTDYLEDGRCCLLTEARVRADRFDLLIEFGSAGSGNGSGGKKAR